MSNSRPAQTSGSAQTSGPAQDSDVPAQPVSRGCSITGLARPGQFDNEPAFPGINLNQNVELGLKTTFDNMIGHFEKAESEAAEALARQLLSWAGLPVLYRVYSHVVLAYGSDDRLHHASKAVELAQRGIQTFGDEQGVGTQLLDIAQRTLDEVNDETAATTANGDNNDHKDTNGTETS